MYSIEEIRENYKNFPDDKVERIARNDAKGLRKEVLNILKGEIIKRNLNRNLITWVNAESNDFTVIEREFLIKQIENLPCPKCLQMGSKLTGYEINRVVSYLIFTDYTTEEKIICNYCGKYEKLNSLLITLVAGWWSRRGILLTPYILIKDLANLFFQKKISNRIIDNFLESNTGLLRLRRISNKTLINLILVHNKKNNSDN